MFLKTFVVVFAALFAFQGCVEARTPLTRAERGAIDVIKELIDQLRKLFDNLIQGATEQIKALWGQIEELVKRLSDEALGFLKKIFEDIKEEIQELIEKATGLGIDVKECVVGQEEAAKALLEKAQGGLKECIDPQTQSASDFIDHALAEFDRVKMEIDTLEKRFMQCPDFYCYTGVIYDGYELLTSIPGRIGNIIQQFAALVTKIQAEVPPCIKDKFGGLVGEANDIKTTVVKCITDKIEQH